MLRQTTEQPRLSRMLPELRNTNAILTGASHGIGPTIGRVLAQAGVNLVLAARSGDELERVAAQLMPLGVKAVAIPVDLAQGGDCDRLVRAAEEALGPIDILVNNAGIGGGGSFIALEPTQIERVIALNLEAPLRLTRSLLPGMVERERGHIVSVASLGGKVGFPYSGVYGATKAGLLTWNTALHVELTGTGVSASAVTPGYVSDVGMHAIKKRRAPWYLGEVKPEAVAQAVLRVLRTGELEVVVTQVPFRPIHLTYVLSPRALVWLMRRMGFAKYAQKSYVHKP